MNVSHVFIMVWHHNHPLRSCSHSTVIHRKAAVLLQQPSLGSGAGPVIVEGPSEVPGPGGGSTLRSSRASWVSLSPSKLSDCVLSVAIREQHSVDRNLSHWRDEVSACLCLLYVCNIWTFVSSYSVFDLSPTLSLMHLSKEFSEFKKNDCFLNDVSFALRFQALVLPGFWSAQNSLHSYHFFPQETTCLPKWMIIQDYNSRPPF